MNILIIDQQELFVRGLSDILNALREVEHIEHASSADTAVTKALDGEQYAVIFAAPDAFGYSMERCLLLLRKLFPTSFPIILGRREDEAISHSFINGDAAFLVRDSKISDLPGILRDIIDSSADRLASPALPPTSFEEKDRQSKPKSFARKYNPDGWLQDPVALTRRQYQIIHLMKEGLPNKEIAARLKITEGTVKTHAHALFQKLDADNRTQAVLKYMKIERQQRSFSGVIA